MMANLSETEPWSEKIEVACHRSNGIPSRHLATVIKVTNGTWYKEIIRQAEYGLSCINAVLVWQHGGWWMGLTLWGPRPHLNIKTVFPRYGDSHVNSLPLGDFSKIIFKLILVNDGCDISFEIALRWTSLELSDEKSTLFQVMAWCH